MPTASAPQRILIVDSAAIGDFLARDFQRRQPDAVITIAASVYQAVQKLTENKGNFDAVIICGGLSLTLPSDTFQEEIDSLPESIRKRKIGGVQLNPNDLCMSDPGHWLLLAGFVRETYKNMPLLLVTGSDATLPTTIPEILSGEPSRFTSLASVKETLRTFIPKGRQLARPQFSR